MVYITIMLGITVFTCLGSCSCLVTSMGPSGSTFVNRNQLPRLIDTETYLGDIISFGERTMAFQLVPVFLPERQKSALDNALHYTWPLATAKQVPKDYQEIAVAVRAMSKKGSTEFPAARALIASALVRDPDNAEGWAQVMLLISRLYAACVPS